MKKRVFSFLLSAALVLGTLLPVQAKPAAPDFTDTADVLYSIGAFKGTGFREDGTPIYDLDKTATRVQGVIFLLRLMGEEAQAEAYTGACPFTDVPAWAQNYLGYAASKGYAAGTSATTFTPDGPLTGNMFLTFVLRALGSKSGLDFEYALADIGAIKAGLIQVGEYPAPEEPLLRGDCAHICYNALLNPTFNAGSYFHKPSETLLVDKLVAAGAMDKAAVEASGLKTSGKLVRSNCDVEGWYDALDTRMNGKVAAVSAAEKQLLGLPADVRWTSVPTTQQEFEQDIMICSLLGNYALNGIMFRDASTMSRLQNGLDRDRDFLHPELYGNTIQLNRSLGFMAPPSAKNVNLPMAARLGLTPYTMPELHYVQKQGVQAARVLFDQTHSKLTPDMAKLDVVKVYMEALKALNTVDVPADKQSAGDSTLNNTIYGTLVAKRATSIGRAAAFNALMNLEGIPSWAIRVGDEPSFQAVNMVCIDGAYFFLDWYAGMGPVTEQEISASYDLAAVSVKAAKAE